jgi:DNA-directed RNA polymerase specialized sigma24 family protein
MADPEGFVPFYRGEAEAVLMFLTRRTLDPEVALDLTAETFAQAWRAWPRVRSDSSEEMRVWLYTIARRQLGHYLRSGYAQRNAIARLGIRRWRDVWVCPSKPHERESRAVCARWSAPSVPWPRSRGARCEPSPACARRA